MHHRYYHGIIAHRSYCCRSYSVLIIIVLREMQKQINRSNAFLSLTTQSTFDPGIIIMQADISLSIFGLVDANQFGKESSDIACMTSLLISVAQPVDREVDTLMNC